MSNMTSNINQNRRRKKKINYGVRAVELCRGKNGFGFTISGQTPCTLSSIVPNSPAEKVGLKPGDCLIAVNGENVAFASHDEVVKRIGTTVGLLKLQIAENCHSESSEDEYLLHRSRSKYPNRVKIKQNTTRAEKVVADLRSGTLFSEHMYKSQKPSVNKNEAKIIKTHNRSNGGVLDIVAYNYNKPNPPFKYNSSVIARMEKLKDQKENSLHKKHSQKIIERGTRIKKYESLPNDQEKSSTIFTSKDITEILYPTSVNNATKYNNHDKDPIIRNAVRYLGSVEMPSKMYLHDSKLQTMHNCIKRLKVEKKVQTLVLMQIFEDRVVLTSDTGIDLAIYPAEKIVFCGVYVDDSRFFGLVTVNTSNCKAFPLNNKNIGSSCHVFMIDSKLQSHNNHSTFAISFNVKCTYDMETGNCLEFPGDAKSLLIAIKKIYKDQPTVILDSTSGLIDFESYPSPSSNNSDSGIGFYYENNPALQEGNHTYLFENCDNASSSSNNEKPSLITSKVQRLTVRAMPDPVKLSRSSSHSSSDGLTDCNNANNLCEHMSKLYKRNSEQFSSSSEHSRQNSTDSGNDLQLSKPYTCTCNTVQYSSKGENFGNRYRTELCIDLEVLKKNKDRCSNFWKPSSNYIGQIRSVSHPEISDSLLVEHGSESSDVEKGQDTLKRIVRNGSFRGHSGTRSKFFQKEAKPTGTFYREVPSPLSLRHASSLNSLDQCGLSCSNQDFSSPTRVATWAVSFDKLLHDSIGLQIFREFLKKEFSEENIMFWIACDEFQKLTSPNQMKIKAREIYEKHLSSSASDPVNVDSQARQNAENGLDYPNPDIFSLAQKQISHLMKFDSYSRFLKSDIYKKCLEAELDGRPLPYQPDNISDTNSVEIEEKKMRKVKDGFDDIDEKRRKSLLPWNRVKSGKRVSKNDEVETKKSQKASEHLDTFEMTGSRASLASGDLVLMQKDTLSKESLNGESSGSGSGDCKLCRVIMPNNATSVIQTKNGETIRSLLQKLCDKKGLNFSSVDVFFPGSDKPIDQNQDSSILGCKEIIIERRVLFRLDLPNRKTVGVKAKPNKTLWEVFNPILHKYGYSLDSVIIHIVGSSLPLNLFHPMTSVDNQQLCVQFKEHFAEWGCDLQRQRKPTTACGVQLRKARRSNSLESLTNKTFEEVFQGKGDGRTHFDELGVLDLDKAKIDNNQTNQQRTSNIFHLKKQNSFEETGIVFYKSKGKGKVSFIKKGPPRLPAAVEQKMEEKKTREENERLFQLLSRAQKHCLDDQRGIGANFELPDFLKLPSEVEDNLSGHQIIKFRNSEPSTSQTLSQYHNDVSTRTSDSITISKAGENFGSAQLRRTYWSSDLDGITPSHLQAEEYFSNTSKTALSPDFNNSQLMEKSLRDIGIENSEELRASYKMNLKCWHSEGSSPEKSPNTTVIENANSTLTSDSSFNLPPLPSEFDQTLLVDEASFSPPTPINKSLKNQVCRPSVSPLCLDDSIPPPLPPKTKSRFMQLNRPIRPFVNVNPSFSHSSSDENADSSFCPPAKNVLFSSASEKSDFTNQGHHSQRTLYAMGQESDSWQISLV